MPRADFKTFSEFKILDFNKDLLTVTAQLKAPLIVFEELPTLKYQIYNITEYFYTPDLTSIGFYSSQKVQEFAEEFEVAGAVLSHTFKRISKTSEKSIFTQMLASRFMYVTGIILIDLEKINKKYVFEVSKYFKKWILDAIDGGNITYTIDQNFIFEIKINPIWFDQGNYIIIEDTQLAIKNNGEKIDWKHGDKIKINYLEKKFEYILSKKKGVK